MFKFGRMLGAAVAVTAGIDAGMNKLYRDSGRSDLSTTERLGPPVMLPPVVAAPLRID